MSIEEDHYKKLSIPQLYDRLKLVNTEIQSYLATVIILADRAKSIQNIIHTKTTDEPHEMEEK